MINQSDIQQSSHIAIITDNASFALANVLYSYILSFHKKVSLVSKESIESKFIFLPWFDKVRSNVPTSADCEIVVDFEVLDFFYFLKEQNFKINAKIATSLYATFLLEDENGKILLCNSEKLLVLAQLQEMQADSKVCYEYLRERKSLAFFRLKSYMFANLVLKKNATLAQTFIDETILKQSGATLQDAYKVCRELLEMVHVKNVQLLKQNKIIYELKE